MTSARAIRVASALLASALVALSARLPLWTMTGVWFAGLLGGSVIIEVIFAIPGMGRLVFDAIVNADIPVAQGGVVLVVICAVLVTSAVDLVQQFSDPNVRVGARHD